MKINEKQHITKRGVIKKNPPKIIKKIIKDTYECERCDYTFKKDRDYRRILEPRCPKCHSNSDVVIQDELGNNGEPIKNYPEDDWREDR